MSRVSISKIRKLELERAALEVVYEKGFRGMTLEQVARHAGISKGIVHHYFLNREELVAGLVRYGNRVYAEIALERIKSAKSPSERLWAIIYARVAPELFQPPYWRAYLPILEEGIQHKQIPRIYSAINARGRSNVAFALRSLLKPGDVDVVTHTIWNLMAGAWLLAASQRDVTRTAVLAIIADYLKNSVPGFDMSVVKSSDK